MSNQNDVPPLSSLFSLQLQRLKAYEDLFGSLDDLYSLGTGPSPFSPSPSDLQTLESSFGRLGVSDSNPRQQQPLLDVRRSNHQLPSNGRDRGMNVRDYWPPSYLPHQSEREVQFNQPLSQRLWFQKDGRVNGYHDAHNNGYGRRNSGVMGPPGFNGDLGEVPSSPINRFCDLSPRRSHPHGHVPHDNPSVAPAAATTLVSRAKDRVESPLLQNVIAGGSRETVDKIFDELIPHVCELTIDPFGRQVFEKLLEKCTDEQIAQVLDVVVIQEPDKFVMTCGHSHGSRAIQDLMRCLRSEEQIARFMVIVCHVALRLTDTTNANNVILFCFSLFSPSQNYFLLQVIVQNFYQVAIDQHGCCMLQHCIGRSSPEIKDPLIREIITNALRLCVNCYGNYLVQYALELEDYEVAAALSRYLEGNYVQLSCDKYGSHAVQKCLRSRLFNSRRIISELLTDIDSLLVNPFGNYVIQTAWIVSQDDVRNELLYHINKNHPLMRCNRYGRKVLEKLNLRM